MLIYLDGQVRRLAMLNRIALLTKPTNNGTQVLGNIEPIRVPMRRRTVDVRPLKKGRLTVVEGAWIWTAERQAEYVVFDRYYIGGRGHNLARWIEPYHDPLNPMNARGEPTRRFEKQKNHPRRVARLSHPRNAKETYAR